ncbi:MAG: DUF4328 domain-containing protein [Acidimicrobiia bacterium]
MSDFPPPPPPGFASSVAVPRESLSPMLAKWTFGMLWLSGVVAAVRGLLAFGVDQSLNEFLDTFDDSALEDFMNRADAYDTIDSVFAISMLATFVLLIIFSFRSYKAGQSLWNGNRKWSRGFSVGGWFIPFANAYIPASLLIETDKISRGSRANGHVDESWRNLSRNNQFVVWFVLYAVGIVLASRISSLDANVDDLEEISNSLVLGAVGNGCLFAASIVGGLALKRMSERLSPTDIG